MVVAAAVLGPTFLANIYQSTNLLPTMLYQLMAGPLIAALLVPPFVRHFDSAGPGDANRFANSAFGAISAGFAIATGIALVASPVLVRLLTVGVEGPTTEAARDATWVLLLLAVPQVLLLGVVGVAVAVQQARGRFAFPAAAQLIENAVVIAVLLVAAATFGVGSSVETVSRGFLFTVGLGTTAAMTTHAAVQWASARALGITLRPSLDWSHEDIREILRLAVPTLGTTGLQTVGFLGMIVITGLIPGGVIAMTLGTQFAVLPIALAARPVSQALLPRLSRLQAAGDPSVYREYQSAVGMVLWIAVPSTLGLAVLSGPLAEAVAFGQMNNDRGIELIRIAIAAFSLTVLGSSVRELARQAAYSQRDAIGPLKINLMRLVMGLPGWAAVLFFVDGPESLLVLGVGAGIADAAAAGLLDRRVRGGAAGARRLLPWLARDAIFALVAATLALLVITGAEPLLPEGRIPTVLLVTGTATLTLVVYVVAQLTAGSPEFAGLHPALAGRPIPDFLARRRSARAKSPTNATRGPLGRRTLLLSFVSPRLGPAIVEGTLVAVFLALALVAVAASLVIGPFVAVAFAGLLVFGIVVLWPPAAALIFLATMPFLAGMERGALLPLLRPNEAVQGVLIAALALRLILQATTGRYPAVRIIPLDIALVAMAVLGSVVPLLWLAVRGEPVTFSEVLATVPFWRYLALYIMIRVSVTTSQQVLLCLGVSAIAACAVALIGIAQVLNVGPVQEVVARFWGGDTQVDIGRGTSTLSSSHASGDYLAFNLAVVLGLILWVLRGNLRLLATGIAALLVLGTLASGQFSGAIGLLLVLVAVAAVAGRARTVVAGGLVTALAGGLLLWPILNARLVELNEGRLPQSWAVRLDNLQTFYLPEILDLGWVLGVRPNSVVDAPELWRVTIFLESGYLWLLWVGGLPLLVAFLWVAAISLRSSFAVLRSRRDPIAVAALGVFAGFLINVVLMVLDPHLTLRGAGDYLFSLMAFATLGGFGALGLSRPSFHAPTASRSAS